MSPVIVVSGPPGVGSSSVARIVARHLGIAYFSPGGWIKNAIGGEESIAAKEGWQGGFLANEDIQLAIDQKQLEIAKQGNVILDGKLSIHVLGAYADFKVWLSGSRIVRIQRLARRGTFSFAEAEQLLISREDLELETWKNSLGIDFWSQIRDADMVVDTDNVTPEGVAMVIIAQVAVHAAKTSD